MVSFVRAVSAQLSGDAASELRGRPRPPFRHRQPRLSWLRSLRSFAHSDGFTCGVREWRTLILIFYDVLPVESLRQVHNDCFPATPHDDPLGWLIGRRIDLLVGNEGRDE